MKGLIATILGSTALVIGAGTLTNIYTGLTPTVQRAKAPLEIIASEFSSNNQINPSPQIVNEIIPTEEQENYSLIKESTREKNLFNMKRLEENIKRHEGVRNKAYDCSEGKRTIGVGFNLERKDAREIIENLGLDFNQVYSGQSILTEQQIDTLFKHNLKEAKDIAINYLGQESFESLDGEAQEIIINMAYNLGSPRLNKFTNLREKLKNRDYVGAAQEMKNSKWYIQVGNRGKELVDRMERLSPK